jgi:zinc protease
MHKRILAALLTLAIALPSLVSGQQALGTPLPADPNVRMGTLANGLHYYIRQNAKPEKRAELRLVVNTGSIQEDDDQLGYAHFIEHMAFNGTEHFKKNELVDYLQSIGLRFGADLNASTSFDETVYNLTVPTDTARIVDKGFLVLADWAHGQLFDSTEVVKERGVVLEEWRGGKGAGERMFRQALPVVFKGTRYLNRLPIGTDTSIMNAQPSVLRRYYTQWYRPDLMAVVAVGDFNVAEIEALINKHFGPIPAARNPRARPATPVPDNQAPLVSIATDKEATSSFIQVGFKRAHEQTRTVGDFRRGLIERIYIGMLNNRLGELTQKPDAPFNGAGMSLGGFIGRDVDAFTLSAGVKDGGIERGFEGVLTEIRRADEFGFLQTELDRSKLNILRGYERSNTERATQPHGAFVGSYISSFLFGTTPLSIEYTYPLVQQLLPTITLSEVNGLATKWITDENRVIMVQAPDKAGLRTPTEADVLAVFNRASRVPVTAYVETMSDAPLLPRLPTPGRVVSERVIPDVGVTEWKLSNGTRVLIKPTDFKADEIIFTGSSDGGTSLVTDAEYMSASYALSIVAASGAGQFNAIDLQKKLAGKAVSAGPSIRTYDEAVSGTASPRDLETMFQLLYLRLTEPRLDTAAWLASKQRTLSGLANRGVSPASVFGDTINAVMTQKAFRARPLTPAILDEVDPVKAIAFYKDRFSDMGDFTFAFVGNIKLDSLKPLVERYLASLPSHGRKETWRAVSNPPPKGVIDKVVRKGTEPKASTQMFFTGPFKYSADNRFALSALMSVFQIRLNETLREQLGGTYSPGAGGSGGRIPREEYNISVFYDSSPENVEKLTQSVKAIIDTLQTRGPSQTDIDKVKEQYTRSRETSIKQNGFWIGNIASREETIDSLSMNLKAYDARVKNLTPAQVQAAAKLYFNLSNFARFVLLPEGPKQ